MALPSGWQWHYKRDSNGKKQVHYATDQDGNRHTPKQARNEAARQAGFRNDHQRGKARAKAQDMTPKNREAWDRDTQRAVDRAKRAAEANGVKWTKGDEKRVRADMDALRAQMRHGPTEQDRTAARNNFLFVTGAADRPDYGY